MSIVEAAPRETTLEAGGYVKGVAIALVTQNKDDDGLCRVKVSYPWHDKPRESYWARLATPMGGKERGLVFIPEVGDEVVVAFEREDLRFPYVLGALWNGKDKPPVNNDDGNNDKRILQSRKKHYLLFDDGSKGEVILFHNKKRKMLLGDDEIVISDDNGNVIKIDCTSGAMTLEAKGDLKISGGSVSIQGKTVEVKASGTTTISGSMVNIN